MPDYFNAPPGWPVPPDDTWQPAPGWAPDPQWPQPPPGWPLWVDLQGRPVPGPAGTFGHNPAITAAGKGAGRKWGYAAVGVLGLIIGSVAHGSSAAVDAVPGPTVTATVSIASEATVTVTATPSTVTPASVTGTASASARPQATKAAPLVASTTAPPRDTQQQAVYYANCSAARAAGVAPLHRGDPGYRAGLDRDNDGIACE